MKFKEITESNDLIDTKERYKGTMFHFGNISIFNSMDHKKQKVLEKFLNKDVREFEVLEREDFKNKKSFDQIVKRMKDVTDKYDIDGYIGKLMTLDGRNVWYWEVDNNNGVGDKSIIVY